MTLRCILLVSLVAIAMATGHSDLHRAREHHSSRIDAQRGGDEPRTPHWIVATDDIDDVVSALNTHLSAGSVQVERRHPLPVIRASERVNHDELSALLMAEQRASRVQWFHRDRVTGRKSH